MYKTTAEKTIADLKQAVTEQGKALAPFYEELKEVCDKDIDAEEYTAKLKQLEEAMIDCFIMRIAEEKIQMDEQFKAATDCISKTVYNEFTAILATIFVK